ncbi:uncharacterized protein LOC118411786 [Branchiostoma floridae]|uniref:Uncharacterized protein LOC118411786 n=1 Tax=Branchiostoma floridae TaxID=7739 RepID=A0A9J7KU03_BRAFL|nr:uncharacterized protein LOC118411786 [Branchiostoma floridae]
MMVPIHDGEDKKGTRSETLLHTYLNVLCADDLCTEPAGADQLMNSRAAPDIEQATSRFQTTYTTLRRSSCLTMDAVTFVVLVLLTGPAVQSADVPCRTFEEIYPTGKELCEKMWDDAFVYETNLSVAFTMWFFEAENPNNKVAERLGWSSPVDDCHLEYFHKEAPGPEPDNFTECHPWKDYSCCHQDTVSSVQKIKEAYGKEWHWDRCGPLSSACERFFVQEACLYECEPNAGFYRKFPDHVYNDSDPNHNKWQMEGMPIRADYCDAWFRACRYDRFCAADSGSYSSCAREYAKVDNTGDNGGNAGLIAGVVVACVIVAVLIGTLGYFIFRERKGQPVFNKLEAE